MINNEIEKEKQTLFLKKVLIFKRYHIICLFPIYLLLILIFIPKKKTEINKNVYSWNLNNCSHNYYQIKKIEPEEKEDGKIFYVCTLCGNEYNESIPMLSSDNYIIENLISNCQHGNGKRYISKKNHNIFYEVTDDILLPHSIYGNKCNVCHQNIGEFNFKKLSNIICDGYPRLYKLSSYWNNTWLLGGDNGTILCRRSEEQGHSWSAPINVSNFPNHDCSNVDFFELPNHEIICSYRAIGKYSKHLRDFYNRKIYSSISKDGGRSWEDLGLIVDNYILSKQLGKTVHDAINAFVKYKVMLGFYEPFVSYINNKITLIYADDFTPALLDLMGENSINNLRVQSIYRVTFDLNTKKWSNKRQILMNGYIRKSPMNSGLMKRPSRDGMPVIAVMKDGTYVMVFEGTYRDEHYKYFTGDIKESLQEFHPFEILISYSKDGENWSNPTEVFVPKNNGSKASAPYICITDNNQIIISFQTDEDSVTNGFIGDSFSVMKVIISKPGIKIENINKDSFYAITNNYRTPIGGKSLWNGMMLIGNILYTCSSGHNILFSEIPLYANSSEYNTNLQKKYYIKSGKVEFNGNKIIIQENKTLLISNEIDIESNNSFYSYVTPNISGICGLIFGFDDIFKKHNIFDYYAFLIKENGSLSIEKYIKGKYTKLESLQEIVINNYNKNNNYKMSVEFNLSSGKILAGINNNINLETIDKELKGKKVGIISDGKGAIFTQILL